MYATPLNISFSGITFNNRSQQVAGLSVCNAALQYRIFLFLAGLLLICLNSFAQSSIILKDTSGKEHQIVFGKTKVTLVFHISERKPYRGKIVGVDKAGIEMKSGRRFSWDIIREIRMDGPPQVMYKPLANYYFAAVNTSLAVVFWGAGLDGWGPLIIWSAVIVTTPFTMVVTPIFVARRARRENPIVFRLERNFR